MRALALALALAAGAGSPAPAAERPATGLPLPRRAAPAPDPRCADDGAAFVYAPALGACVRIGGLVGVEVSAQPRGRD